MIHPSAQVASANIGTGTRIWQHVVVLKGAQIGCDVNVCAHCFIEDDVQIGDRSTVKCGVYLWNGIKIGEDVFIGPNVTFCNDRFPRSRDHSHSVEGVVVEDGASVGAGSVILPCVTIGKKAMVGAGSVVTQSVPPYAIVKGNPARITGYIEDGDFADIPQDFPVGTAQVARIGVGDVTVHNIKLVNDLRGDLSAGEFSRDIPFIPKRYFVVFNVPSEKSRGAHAHKHCKQFLVCVRGRCSVVADDGQCRREVLLDSPSKGIYLPPMVWGIQYKYSEDAVLLVFASEFYDAEDYIRDYGAFCAATRELSGDASCVPH